MSRPRKNPLPESANPTDIAPETEAPKDKPRKPEPARTERGDIDPTLIEWRRENWAPADFAKLYPVSRLRQIGIR